MDLDLEQYMEPLDEYLEREAYEEAGKYLFELPNPDIAEILTELDDIDIARKILTTLSAREQASIFGYLRPAVQAQVAAGMSRRQLAALFEHMDHDERADLYNRLSESERWAVLPGLAHAEREDIRQLASYPDDTAGSVMTSAYVTLRPEQTVAEALETIRLEAPDVETIYQSYVLEADRKLVGTISLRDLMLANPSARIGNLMIRDVIQSRASASKYEAARQIARYDILAVPVVNDAGQMVGIVTHDDALDVTEDESTQDQHRLGAVTGLTTSLSESTIYALYRTRVGWLVILVFGNIFSGASLAHFEDLIERVVTLVFFLPLLIDSGGNAGSQSSTLMVRALATEDVHARDWFRLLGKELMVALLLGLSMAAAVSILGFWRGGGMVALIVSITMIIIVVVGSLIGMSLPFLLTKFKQDPASASAPLVTTICDGVGVLIYFSVASTVFNFPA